MTLCINQSGTWRDITTQCVNQSGTWRKITTGCINQSGTWRKFGFFTPPSPGDSYEGGRAVCVSSGIVWVVAPSSSEVARTWYSRNDANTRAQQVSGCTGWFVPTCAQLRDPAYSCRAFWDTYSRTRYWSSTEFSSPAAWIHFFQYTGNSSSQLAKCSSFACIRSFRCVTY